MVLWIIAHQAPLFMEFPRLEYCSGLPFPSSGDFSDPGIEPVSPILQANSLTSDPPGNNKCQKMGFAVSKMGFVMYQTI